MSTERVRSTLSLGLALAAALGLSSTTTYAQEEASAPSEDTETIWSFLQAKYDVDGDAQISREEYDRGDEAFARLDEDDDGTLEASDFAEGSGRSGGGLRPEMVAPMILMRYFDGDEEDEGLTREELERTHATFDTNDDDRLSRQEFEEALEQRGADEGGMMGMRMDRFSMLLGVADRNDDLHLSNEELLAWFDERDTDANGVWSPQGGRRGAGAGPRGPRGAGRDGPRGPRGPRGAGRDGSRGPEAGREADEQIVEDPSPSALGKIAPDFELEPPHGGKPVQLASFKGEKPVALIFGSYT